MNSSEKEEKKPKKRGISLWPIKTVIKVGVAIILLGLSFGLGMKLSTNFETQQKTTKFGLEDVGELVTQTCHATVLEDSKVNRDFFHLFDIPFTESRQIFSYDYEVDASVDFASIEYSVDEEKKEVKFTLSHAKVYKVAQKLDSFREYLDTESLFSRIDLTKHNEALKEMEEQAVEDCVGNKLLEAGDNNARRLLEAMVKGNKDYKDYEIVFEYREG